jgi:hypothetical protein
MAELSAHLQHTMTAAARYASMSGHIGFTALHGWCCAEKQGSCKSITQKHTQEISLKMESAGDIARCAVAACI